MKKNQIKFQSTLKEQKQDFEVEQNEINQVEKDNVNLSINGFDSSNFSIGYPWRHC